MKRFWKAAEVVPSGDGYAVMLDGRGIKTPARRALVVPTEVLARAIAEEWQAQEDRVDPLTMPFTRTANSALDKVAVQHDEVADMLAAYGDSDLLCYRAEGPGELVARQAEAWDPMLDWAAEALGARLALRQGVMHRPQDPAALARLSAEVHALGAFQLAAFHDLVSMTGSLVLGFAAARQIRSPDAIWQLSRVDEIWQAEQWGEDEEATALAYLKASEFSLACRFHHLCR